MAENAEKKEARYAHSEGHVNVCYDDNGGHLISSGSEGEVRVYAGYDDDDPSHHAMGGCVYSMAVKNQKFYSSCDDNTIAVHTFPSWEKDGLITRFTAPVTHMTFDESGETLVAGSADFTVKVVDVVTSSEQVLRGHEAPVLSVALHPQGGYVASSSCDGTLRLWSTEQQRVVHTITGFPKSNDFSAALLLCRMAWDKSGKYLAVPFEKGVRVYNQGIWDIAFTLSDKFIEKSLSIVTFSPSGEYLASAAVDGSLIVWNFQEKRCLTRMRHPQRLRVTSLAWDKSGIPELVYGDANGHIGLFQDVIPADEDRKKDDGLTAEQLADLFEDDENMAKDDIDHDEIAALKKVALGLDEDSLDTGSIQGNAAHVQPPPTRIVEVGFKPTPAQPAFQPSSTPVNWSHRYMVWNTVGLALQYSTDEEQSVVVEFHDTATHHPLHIPNGPGYTMAALSDQALVLAAPSDGEAVSQVVCMHFNAWDKSKEWTCGMPEEEDIEAICIGEGWLAVATNMRHVRVFTVAGLQKDIFSIPGPVVAMAAHSNQLFIVYHSGMGLPGDQCLGFRLMYVAESKKKSVVDSAALPLSPSSTLAWIGFTSEGTPTIVDSSGAVRLFNRSFAQTWSQIASLRNHCKGKSDNYWVIGLVENPPQMRAIQVKGGKHPATLPRPTPHVLPLQIPLCNISDECGSLEEAYGRQKLLSQHMDWWTSQNYDFDEERQQKSQMSQSESLMKLFALACKSERLCRAIEICELMPHEHTLQLAIKYASRLRLLTLAEKISDLIRRRMAEAAVAVEEEEEEEEEEEQEQGLSQDIFETPAEEDGESMQVEEQNSTPGPFLSLKSKESETNSASKHRIRKNPFKSSAPKTATPGIGSKVFDNMEKAKAPQTSAFGKNLDTKITSNLKLKVAKKKPGQTKLFNQKKDKDTQENSAPVEKKTGFQIWFDANRESLAEEHANLGEDALVVTAAKAFKALEKSEQQEWKDRAKGETRADEDETKKRKRKEDEIDENQDESESKKSKGILSQNTTSKLAGFAFKN